MQKKISAKTAYYQKSSLPEWFSDIDYEMLPIIEEHKSDLSMESAFIFIDHLMPFDMKEKLKKAKQFKIVNKANPQSNHHSVIHIYPKENKTNTFNNQTYDQTILLPIKKIEACKKNKKQTEFILTEGQVLKTAIKFKKIKKSLLKNGFKETKEGHLVFDKPETHFP